MPQKIKQFLLTKKFNFFHLTLALVFLIITASILFNLQSQKYQTLIENIEKENLLTATSTQKTDENYEQKAERDYFIEEILPKYPSITEVLSVDSIQEIFAFTYKDENYSLSWLVETETYKENQPQLEYYLVTPYYQKKLEHPMTNAAGNDAPCTLDSFKTIGNEDSRSLRRDLQDKAGYMVLTGSDCQYSYGGGNFVSVYSLSDGKKIPLQDNSDVGYTQWPRVTKYGNAQGRLMGVYGVLNPQIIVKFGGFDSAATYPEEIYALAFFDLQTGKLLRTTEFK